jgi:hypothetical protein
MLPILQSGVDRENGQSAKYSACQVEVMEADAEPSGNAESSPALMLPAQCFPHSGSPNQLP